MWAWQTQLLLSVDGLSDNVNEMLGVIKSSVQHLQQIIDDILDMTKIESGKFRLHLEPCSIRTCVKESMDIVRRVAENKGLKLSCTLSPKLKEAVMVSNHGHGFLFWCVCLDGQG